MPEPIDYGDRVDGPSGAGSAASLAPTTDRDGRLHPRNPWVGLAVAVLLLTIAVSGLAALILEPTLLFASTNRRAGLLLVIPGAALVAGVITLVRGFLAIRPWMAHRRATPLALRRQERAADLHRQPLWRLVVVGFLSLAGFTALAIVFSLFTERTVDLIGRLVQVEILTLLALITAGCLGLAAQKIYFARFFVGRDPRGTLPPR